MAALARHDEKIDDGGIQKVQLREALAVLDSVDNEARVGWFNTLARSGDPLDAELLGELAMAGNPPPHFAEIVSMVRVQMPAGTSQNIFFATLAAEINRGVRRGEPATHIALSSLDQDSRRFVLDGLAAAWSGGHALATIAQSSNTPTADLKAMAEALASAAPTEASDRNKGALLGLEQNLSSDTSLDKKSLAEAYGQILASMPIESVEMHAGSMKGGFRC